MTTSTRSRPRPSAGQRTVVCQPGQSPEGYRLVCNNRVDLDNPANGGKPVCRFHRDLHAAGTAAAKAKQAREDRLRAAAERAEADALAEGASREQARERARAAAALVLTVEQAGVGHVRDEDQTLQALTASGAPAFRTFEKAGGLFDVWTGDDGRVNVAWIDGPGEEEVLATVYGHSPVDKPQLWGLMRLDRHVSVKADAFAIVSAFDRGRHLPEDEEGWIRDRLASTMLDRATAVANPDRLTKIDGSTAKTDELHAAADRLVAEVGDLPQGPARRAALTSAYKRLHAPKPPAPVVAVPLAGDDDDDDWDGLEDRLYD